MNHAALLKQFDEQRSVVQDVLQGYLQTHLCPCAWPQFRFWVAKERPTGSYDPIQNLLVEAALALPIYTQAAPIEPRYWLEAEVRCSVCGTRWLYFCEEWRMLGYHKQLIRADEFSPDPLLIQALYEKIGCDPSNRLDLEKWFLFMQSQ